MVNCKNKLIITISFGFTTILWKNWVILSHFKHTLLLTPYDPPLISSGDSNFEIRHDFIASKVEFWSKYEFKVICWTKSYVEKKFILTYVFYTYSAVMDTFFERFSKSRLFLKSASLSDSDKVIGFFQYHPGGQPYLIFHLWWKPGT